MVSVHQFEGAVKESLSGATVVKHDESDTEFKVSWEISNIPRNVVIGFKGGKFQLTENGRVLDSLEAAVLCVRCVVAPQAVFDEIRDKVLTLVKVSTSTSFSMDRHILEIVSQEDKENFVRVAIVGGKLILERVTATSVEQLVGSIVAIMEPHLVINMQPTDVDRTKPFDDTFVNGGQGMSGYRADINVTEYSKRAVTVYIGESGSGKSTVAANTGDLIGRKHVAVLSHTLCADEANSEDVETLERIQRNDNKARLTGRFIYWSELRNLVECMVGRGAEEGQDHDDAQSIACQGTVSGRTGRARSRRPPDCSWRHTPWAERCGGTEPQRLPQHHTAHHVASDN